MSQFLTDVAIRCHEVGLGPLTEEQVLAQLDEVIRRWHEAERRVQDYDLLNGRLIILENQGWTDRQRITQLETLLSVLDNQLKAMRVIAERSTMTYVAAPNTVMHPTNTQP